MAAEDNPLQTLDPFLGAGCRVGAEVVGAVMGDNLEMDAFLLLVGDPGGYAEAEVDLSMGKVEVSGIAIIGQNMAHETKPVPVVLGITFATLGQVTGLGDNMLQQLVGFFIHAG